jgi:hypothetical protein
MNYPIACLFWEAAGIVFLLIGLYDYLNQRNEPVGFFSNLSSPSVTDVKAFNQSVGKAWLLYFAGYEVLGLLILFGNENVILFGTILGIAILSILLVAVYTAVILPHYRAKDSKEETVNE